MNDTIAAISTAPVSSALGVIRMSGPASVEIAAKILTKNYTPLDSKFFELHIRKAILCNIEDHSKFLDQIIAVYYKAPHSFTGEDLIELSLHGNPILLNLVLSLLFQNGARPAERGEFTKRAYLNGKIQISEAEAIQRIIHSRSKFELELSQKNLTGEMGRLASRIRSGLISLKAEFEAEIDFSTEDLTFETKEERRNRFFGLLSICKEILRKSEIADQIISGFKAVIYGSPNSGKSSLLNCLLGKDRAIVSSIPGTTRDYISEKIHIDGIPIELVDTAGVRETIDDIERIGIEKSEKEFLSANVRIFLIDSSIELDWKKFIEDNRMKLSDSILVANKIDIKHQTFDREYFLRENSFDYCEISCVTKSGIEELFGLISDKLRRRESADDYVILEERNKNHFRKIICHLENSFELFQKDTFPEISVKEIDYAIEEVGAINGKIDTEEILGRIFSKFCVGK